MPYKREYVGATPAPSTMNNVISKELECALYSLLACANIRREKFIHEGDPERVEELDQDMSLVETFIESCLTSPNPEV
jgi:hypothetical protein